MSDQKTRNIEIFEDTIGCCKNNQVLKSAVLHSGQAQYIIAANEVFGIQKEHRYAHPVNIVVSKKRSLEAAGAYRGKKVCVHNFASATNPGGGVTRGSSAQEEAICRCSTLYPSLVEMRGSFYDKHRQLLKEGKLDAVYNDDCIFTPGVVVFKTDTQNPEKMPEKDWYTVDIVTCAAPNLREKPSNAMNPGSGSRAVKLSEEQLLSLHKKRMTRILSIAKKEGAEVVVLGAFGCGAFCNPPEVVAEAMAQAVKAFQYDFSVIEFAVYCSPRDEKNYRVFWQKFNTN